jgi:hypothetical protein
VFSEQGNAVQPCRWVKKLLQHLTSGGRVEEWGVLGWVASLWSRQGSALLPPPRVKPVLGISALIGTRQHGAIPLHVHWTRVDVAAGFLSSLPLVASSHG